MAHLSAQQHHPWHRLLGKTSEPQNCPGLLLQTARLGSVPFNALRVESLTELIGPGRMHRGPVSMRLEVRPLNLMRERASDHWPAVAPSSP